MDLFTFLQRGIYYGACSYMCCVRVCVSHPVMSDSLRPHGLAHQAPLPMDSPGKNTGVGCHFLLHIYVD